MDALKLLLRYAKKYRGALFVTVISMLLLVGVQLLIPWIIRTMIALVTRSESTQGTGQTAIEQITLLALLALAAFVVKAVLQFLRSYMSHVAGWGVVADVRQKFYEHMQRLSLRFHANTQTGQLMSRIVHDSDMLERLIAHAMPDVIVNVLMFIGVCLVLVNLKWQLLLLSLIPIPLIILGMQAFARYVRPAFKVRQQRLSELNAVLGDNLSGIREIKAFVQEESEAERISTHIKTYLVSNLKALRLMAIFHPFIEWAASLGTIIIIYFGGKLAIGQVLAVEDLVAFFLYLELFYQPVRILSGSWEQVQEAMAGTERIAELMNEEVDVQEKPGAIKLPQRVRGEISFRDVSFRYERGNAVLSNINLNIHSNMVVALVGQTGVGKTTLVSLIPRFYDVTKGVITLDGYNLKDLKLDSLRRQISIVLQDVFLFHGTARENILFGKPQATEEEVINAARVANAHEFITKLPQGYDTLIGERGVKLSGGQKQRLAIARAVLKDAPILILDEATSSVDTKTEILIQQALERLMQGRTTLIIAHRLSTIQNADLIVVLDDTGIAEMGTHKELMACEGLYRNLNQARLK